MEQCRSDIMNKKLDIQGGNWVVTTHKVNYKGVDFILEVEQTRTSEFRLPKKYYER